MKTLQTKGKKMIQAKLVKTGHGFLIFESAESVEATLAFLSGLGCVSHRPGTNRYLLKTV